MLTAEFISYAFIIFFLFERLLELIVNQFNKVFMEKKHFAKLKFPREAFQMRIFHSLWFISLIVETYFNGGMLTGGWFYFCVIVLLMSQILRWYAIYSLGTYWSIDIYQMKEHPVVVAGPYAYIRHPNYLAVIIEFIFLPLLLGCLFTLFIGTIANFFILKRRIYLEEQSLDEQSSGIQNHSNYRLKFFNKNRFLVKLRCHL